jgi:tripartite-type tricarboxylate transporter receptor subunit TctC
MISRRNLVASAVLAGVPFGLARADEYPSRTVRFVVSTGAGTATDTVARYLATVLSKAWNQSIVVENVNGAGGVIATTQVFNAARDGYTLLFTYASHYSNQWIMKTPYDAVADFEPVARVATTSLLLITGAASPYHSVKDVIEAAKAKPGGLAYGSAGNGTTGHMAGALFASMAGIQLRHVPYKTPGQAALDAAAGVVDLTFTGPATALPLIHGGRARAIAATSTRRTSYLPDVPTFQEAGLAGYENSSPVWLLATRGTPRVVIDKLSDAITRIAATPAFKEVCTPVGLEPDVQAAAQERADAPAQLEKWRKLVALTAANSN